MKSFVSKKYFRTFSATVWIMLIFTGEAAFGQVSLIVEPESLDWKSNAWVQVTVSNFAAGAELDIQLFLDVQGNGMVDPADPLVANYHVEDGVTNSLGSPLIVDDEDGSINGSVISRIAYFGNEDGAKRLVGTYAWRAWVIGGGISMATSFAITQAPGAVWITGRVIDAVSSNGIANAVVGANTFAALSTPSMWTDINGGFTYYLPDDISPADVQSIDVGGLGCISLDFDPDDETQPFSAWVFTNDLHAGENVLPVDLRLFATTGGPIHEVTGYVYDDHTNALPAVGVGIEWGEDNDVFTMTDSNGFYRVLVPGFNEGEIGVDSSSLMYAGLLAAWQGLTVTGNMTGVDLYCPRGTLLVRGRVLATDNQDPVTGANVFFGGESFGGSGVSFTDGSYAVALIPHGGYSAEAEQMEWLGYLDSPELENLEITDHSWTNFDWEVERGFFVSGTVYDTQTNTLTGGYVGAFRYPSQNQFWNFEYGVAVNRQGFYKLFAPTGELALLTVNFVGYVGKVYANYDYWDWDYDQSADVIVNTSSGVDGINFYLPHTAVIQGHVRGDSQGLPDYFVFVEERIGEDDYQWRGGADTDENGFYSIYVAPGSNYIVSVQVPDNEGVFWLPEYYSNKVNREEADLVATTAEAPATYVDFDLEKGGIISGWVLDGSGNPVPECFVAAEINDHIVRDGQTDENGHYSFSVPPGTYLLEARPDWGDLPFVRQYYSNAYSEADAADVVVVPDEEISNIVFRLTAGGTISGHVYQENGVTPLANCHVYATEYDSNDWHGGADTDENGAYTLRVLPGEYRVGANPSQNGLRFESKFYNNVSSYDEATRVFVEEDEDTAAIDFTLSPVGAIMGFVYEEDGVTPVANCHVGAEDFNTGEWINGVDTDIDGSYVLLVPAGSYRVTARPSNSGLPFIDIYYTNNFDWFAATEVQVIGDGDTTGIDFKLQQGRSISGRVTEENGVTPIPDCWLMAEQTMGSTMQGRTDQDGYFTIYVLPGMYIVAAHPEWDNLPYVTQYYSNTVFRSEAMTIDVGEDEDVSDINFLLQSGGTISGHIYQGDGTTPLADCHVYISEYDSNEWMAGGFTDDQGAYTLRLPPGDYRVRAYPSDSNLPYESQYYSNTVDYISASRVEVMEGQNTGAIDFNLIALSYISGHVYESDGITPVADCWVGAESVTDEYYSIYTSTESDGSYSLQIDPGDYRVQAVPQWSMLNFYDVYYSNKWWQSEADTVSVASAGQTDHIDFHLTVWDSVTDSDSDHMNDAWENDQFGSIHVSYGTNDFDEDGLSDIREYVQNSNPNISDTDEDHSSDLEEWIAGTDPNLETSRFEITMSATGRPTFAWLTVTGRLYSVYDTTNLMHGQWSTNLYRSPGDGALWNITNGGASHLHYRLGVERTP